MSPLWPSFISTSHGKNARRVFNIRQPLARRDSFEATPQCSEFTSCFVGILHPPTVQRRRCCTTHLSRFPRHKDTPPKRQKYSLKGKTHLFFLFPLPFANYFVLCIIHSFFLLPPSVITTFFSPPSACSARIFHFTPLFLF